MKKNTKKQETELTMDMLLKMTPEVFTQVVKNQPLGFNQSLLNLLKVQYEQCTMAKDSLVNVLVKAETMSESEKEEYNKAINDLYLCMQLIEDRHTILDIVIKESSH